MKKFVNDPQQFVPEMLKGIELANPGKLRYVPEYNLIMRADAPRDDKVSIVQGSGSGHEPAHVMVVGKGMLDAACPGDVFAAPPSDYVYETTKLMASEKGVLHIINNYTRVSSPPPPPRSHFFSSTSGGVENRPRDPPLPPPPHP